MWNTYARTVTYVRDVLSRDGLRQPSKRHLWRASFPIHANIDGRCSPTASLDDTQNWMNRVAGNIVGGEVPVLDMWPVMEAQGAYGGRAGPIPENLTRRAGELHSADKSDCCAHAVARRRARAGAD